jgi:hypothetical protein
MANVVPYEFFRCPHCAAKYWVTYTTTRTRDTGSAYCVECRKKMIEWNDVRQPSFSPATEVQGGGREQSAAPVNWQPRNRNER